MNFGVSIGKLTILENINLHVHCGELTVLIGPNGAGKTTLFKAMLGELPHRGTIRFVRAGEEEGKMVPRIGYVPQKLEIDEYSPVSVLDLFAGVTSRWPLWLGYRSQVRDKARQMLAIVQSEELLLRPVGKLSGGQLQRVLLALALTPDPDLLLLDEPISGVDPAGVDLFYQMISQLRQRFDLSILLISQDLSAVARVADRMILLNHAVICDGTPRQVLADRKLRQAFGIDFNSGTDPGSLSSGEHRHH